MCWVIPQKPLLVTDDCTSSSFKDVCEPQQRHWCAVLTMHSARQKHRVAHGVTAVVGHPRLVPVIVGRQPPWAMSQGLQATPQGLLATPQG